MMKRNKEDYQVNGLLDRGCSFEGKLMFDGTVQVNGNFRGEILSDGTLIVGPEAQINAKVQVDTLIADGNVQGVVIAKKKVELHSGSRLIANVIAPSFVIEEGAIFHGQCHMVDEADSREGTRIESVETQPALEETEDALMM